MDSQGRVKATKGQWNFCATYTGQKPMTWDERKMNWNHHRISVHNSETGLRCYFDFWASEMQPEIRERREVYEAVTCFLSDALMGDDTFEEFCGACGYYDEDSRAAEKVWKACKQAAKKLERVAGGWEDALKLMELLEDYR